MSKISYRKLFDKVAIQRKLHIMDTSERNQLRNSGWEEVSYEVFDYIE